MSKSCLRHNRVRGLRGAGVIEIRDILFTMATCQGESGRYSIWLLGGLIFWLMGVVAVEGKITPPPRPATLMGNHAAQDNSRHTIVNRRDPFKRIKKRMPPPMVSKKSHPESTIVPVVEDPLWRLLAVIHGQDGRQAVIQISPKERVIVQPGSELVRSGWIIRTISDGGVLLERLSSTSSVGVSSPPRNFILSFPASRKSP